MSELPDALAVFSDAAATSPMALRVLVGAMGALLLVAGARVYWWGLTLSAFALGAIGATTGLQAVADVAPQVWTTPAVLVVAAVGGLVLAGLARMAHRVALLGIGAVAGGVGAAAVAPPLGLIAWWVPLVGAVIGALAFPFLFEWLLKLLTPAVGAVALVWAAGMPEQPWLLGLLWLVGAAIQLGFVETRSVEVDE